MKWHKTLDDYYGLPQHDAVDKAGNYFRIDFWNKKWSLYVMSKSKRISHVGNFATLNAAKKRAIEYALHV